MRLLIAVAGLCVLAAGAAAQDAKYESKAGRYLVAFPGKPTVKSQKAGDIELNIASVEKGAGGFLVMYSDQPEAAAKQTPKEVLDASEQGLLDSFKTKAITSKEVTFGKGSLSGREVIARQAETYLRVRLVLVERRLYQVFVVGPKELTESKEADAYFASFEVTK